MTTTVETASTADLLAAYNALTGQAVKKFQNRATAVKRVRLALAEAGQTWEQATGTLEPEPEAEAKPAPTPTAPAGNPNAAPLAERAMLVSLKVRRWTARRSDADVTAEVAQAHGSETSWGNFTKRLVAKEALAEITRLEREARSFHWSQTLPWTDEGQRILPAAVYMAYAERMRDFRAQFDAAVATFVADYQRHVEDARVRLNGMFRAKDYPDASEIQERFSLDVAVVPMPTAQAFRVTLDADELARVQAQIEERTQQALQDATKDLWNRVHWIINGFRDALRRYQDALDGAGKPRLYSAWLSDLKKMVGTMGSLNITDDPEMERVRRELADSLEGVDIEDLKADDRVRANALADTDRILSSMAGYTG